MLRIGSRGSISCRLFSTTATSLSGHNKWSTIKRDKAKNDLQRANLAFKVAQQITIAVRTGGADPEGNPGLANCLERAKKMSVPKKVIDSAIKRASGQSDSKDNQLETVTYEGMGPMGVAVIIELLTDNKSRTVGFIKPCFSKHGGQLTPTQYMFDKRGFITVDTEGDEFDNFFEKILDCGALDIEEMVVDEDENPKGELIQVITDPVETAQVTKNLKEQGFKITDQVIGYKPKEDMMITVNEDQKSSVEKFLNKIDEVDDVTSVYTNIKD